MGASFIGINLLRISVLLVVVWVFHAKIGKYPKPLPSNDNLKREMWEVGFLWILQFAIMSIFAYLVFSVGMFDPSDPYSLELLIVWAGVQTVPGLVIPLLFVRFGNTGARVVWEDLGFSTKIQQKTAWMYVILVQVILIIASLIFVRPEPAPVFFLLLSVYTPVFLEEFLYRGVIQSKLERAMGQNKGWFYGGIVFGLVHIPINFFAPFWLAGDPNIVAGLLLLGGQIVNGWWLGIAYAKTRSLIPGILVHYMADFLGNILAWLFI
jgi:membrane protease YdiL (CAAX protease family)